MVRFVRFVHKWTGFLLSLVFCIWFLSGFVLIFAGFPHYSQQEAFRALAVMDSATVNGIALPDSLPPKNLTLETYNGRGIYRAGKLARTASAYDAVTLAEMGKPDSTDCLAVASRVVKGDIVKVKKIRKLDIWLPWAQYKSSLPIYKVYFNDKDRSVAYVSSKNATIVQLTTVKERWLAAIGAIPHYIFFKYLSLSGSFWNSLLIGLIAAGGVMCLCGIILGIVRMTFCKCRIASPYKKPWFKLHHVTGFYLGIFTITFLLSAYISVSGVPSWMGKESRVSYQSEWNEATVSMNKYTPAIGALKSLIAERGDVRRVAFGTSLGKPCFKVYAKSSTDPVVYMISGDKVTPLKEYTVKDIESYAKETVEAPVKSVTLITAYDSYYQLTRMGSRPLPVVKLTVADKSGSWLYVSTQTGEMVTVYDSSRRVERWLYRALHTFNLQWLKEHEWLRMLLLMVVCAGGFIISLSGLVLTAKWIGRKALNGVKRS